MIHLGDITKLNGANIPVVDCIIGGSPCQDLSVAGKRAGLDGERSGLFMDQIRIVKEMRENDKRNGRSNEFIRPRFMVWENVPGAFSANNGEDFRAVLEETARIADRDAVIPRPEGGGVMRGLSWATDGLSLGAYMTRSFGESPSVAVESRLSQILEDNPHPKYCLSAKACQGILRRAKQRGKKLPEQLKDALIEQSAFKNDQENPGGAKEY